MIKKLIFILLSSISLIAYPTIANATALSINAGTTIKTRIAEPIDSRVRKVGYQFRVTIDSDIEKEGKTVIKSGSKAHAVITHIQKSGNRLDAPAIIIALTKVNIGSRQINAESFQVAGKGKSRERKVVGEIDENENLVFNQQGEKISTTFPIITKGYDLILTEGTIVYFILKEPIDL